MIRKFAESQHNT